MSTTRRLFVTKSTANIASILLVLLVSGLTGCGGGSGSHGSTTISVPTPAPATMLTFAAQPTSVIAGTAIAPAITVLVTDSAGHTVNTSTAPVTITLNSMTASGVLGGTTTVNAVQGVATFSNLSIAKAGTGYTLTAQSPNLAGGASSAFTVLPGSATTLVFSVQPSNVTAAAAITPAVTVAVQDANGNTVTNGTPPVIMTIATNGGKGALAGTTSVAAVDGVASFTNLSITAAGSGYTLAASSPGLSSAISSMFSVQYASDTNPVTITVLPNASPTSLASNFNGLSFEKNVLTNPGLFSASNAPLVSLFKLLGPGVLRLGGNSADQMLWNPNGTDGSPYVMGPANLMRLAGFLQATHWQLIYALNFTICTATTCPPCPRTAQGPCTGPPPAPYTLAANGALNPSGGYTNEEIASAGNYSAQEAIALYDALAAINSTSSLIGFEIGNEPDLFRNNGLRANNAGYTYTPAEFVNEWQIFAEQIKQAVPSATFVGPADSSGYDASFASALAYANSGANSPVQVSLLTQHYYAGAGDEDTDLNDLEALLGYNLSGAAPPANPPADPSYEPLPVPTATAPNDTITYLTNAHNLANQWLPQLSVLTSTPPVIPGIPATAVSVPGGFRLGEVNAFGGYPAPGADFGTALWALDFEFLSARNHAGGINFHDNHPPIQTDHSSGAVTAVNPLYYAMYLFSLVANGSTLRTEVSAQGGTLSAYGVAGNDGTTYVVVNNKDIVNSVAATIHFMQPAASASSALLTAPAITSSTGYSFGGATLTPGGTWTNSVAPQFAPISLLNGAAVLTIPAASAVLVRASLDRSASPPTVSSTTLRLSNGYCMDVTAQSYLAGAVLQQHACTEKLNESFAFTSTPDGYYTISSNESDLCLDAAIAPGSLVQNPCSGSDAQKWQLTKHADGTYSLSTYGGAWCVGVPTPLPTVSAAFLIESCASPPKPMDYALTLVNPPSPVQQPTSRAKPR